MKILKWIIAIPFVVLVLFVLARFAFCRPNYSVVKTATPMVEKMADYIVNQGMPDSLEQIPDLPYMLNQCEKNITYEKEGELRDIKVHKKEEADWVIYKEECNFIHKEEPYILKLWFIKHYKSIQSTHGYLDIEQCKTSVGTSFVYEDGKLISVGIGSNLDTRFGFCRPFKQ